MDKDRIEKLAPQKAAQGKTRPKMTQKKMERQRKPRALKNTFQSLNF
jgi:hypothetical protein